MDEFDQLEAKYRVWLLETIAKAFKSRTDDGECLIDDGEYLKEYVVEYIDEFEEKTEIPELLYLDLILYVYKHGDCMDAPTMIYCATELWVGCKLNEEDWDGLFTTHRPEADHVLSTNPSHDEDDDDDDDDDDDEDEVVNARERKEQEKENEAKEERRPLEQNLLDLP
jgi:hypothetical protein